MLRFRDSIPQDVGALYALDQLCFQPGIAYSRRELEFFLNLPRGFTILAEGEQRVAGFVIINRVRSQLANVITIDVHPEFRRTGLAMELMLRSEARLLDTGISKLVLEVAVDNHPALCFYRKLGYSVLKSLPLYYKGEIDGLRMGKLLK